MAAAWGRKAWLKRLLTPPQPLNPPPCPPPRRPPPAPAGPTIATAGLALQLPLAMALDAVLRSPAWLDHAGSIVMTLLGAGLVVGGFLGVNAAGEDDEKTRHEAWEQRQAVRAAPRLLRLAACHTAVEQPSVEPAASIQHCPAERLTAAARPCCCAGAAAGAGLAGH